MLNRSCLATVILVFQGLAILAAPGCSHSKPADAARTVTPWEGRLQSLFDDSIDPTSLGLAPTSTDPKDANVARGQAAHFVVRARASTVTVEGQGNKQRYVVTLRVVGDPIVGARPPSDTIQIAIGYGSPSFGPAQSKDLQLAGTPFIAFLREFEANDGPVLHWHLARDAQDVADAAREGAVLESSTD
jgi:hypothetical protein